MGNVLLNPVKSCTVISHDDVTAGIGHRYAAAPLDAGFASFPAQLGSGRVVGGDVFLHKINSVILQ